jgi:hypothetical protein
MNMNGNLLTNVERAAHILKAFEPDIQKGGIGSGRKIGTTTSGKDIYDHFDHPSHKKFGLTDHKDAVTPHAQIAAKLIGKKESKKETFTKEDKAALAHHGEQAKLHFQASKGD